MGLVTVIRFDALRSLAPKKLDLGNVVRFDDPEEVWATCDVPCGSEGSLQYFLWENPNEDHLAAYTAMFWGDLRNYNDKEEICAYFNRIVTNQFIRSGHFEINVENQGTWLY